MPQLRHLAMGNAKKRTTKQYNVRGFGRASSDKQAQWDKKLREVNDKRAALIEEKKEMTREMIVHKQQRKELRIKARTWLRIHGWYLSLRFWEQQFDSVAGIRTERREKMGAASCIQTRWKKRNDWKLQEFQEKLGAGGGWRLIFGTMINKRWKAADLMRRFLQDHVLVYKFKMVTVIMKTRFKMRIRSMQKFAVSYLLCTQARIKSLGKMFDRLWDKVVKRERKRLKLARRDAAQTAAPEELAHDKKWSYIDRHLTKKLNKFLDSEHKIATSTSWYTCPESIRMKILRRYLLKCRKDHISKCSPAFEKMKEQSELEKSGRRNYTLDDIKSMMSLDPRHSPNFGADSSSPQKRVPLRQKEQPSLANVELSWPELHCYSQCKEEFEEIIVKTITRLQGMSASQTKTINRRASDALDTIEQADLNAEA
jgi:hypothetical protein